VSSAFSFDQEGAKEKAWQKEKRHKEAISPSAEGEEGSAPSTARAFEKTRPKLFVKLTKAGCFVYSLKP
ncbi:MAG: hypothetical protein IJW92_06645, partial [Clostridia bacterium]|nr:hypothetical protein [Clostridia bacterium]